MSDALAAVGVAVWAMTDPEADAAPASAARIADEDQRVDKACIGTPDKNRAQ